MESIGKYLLVIGIVVAVLGVGLMFFEKISFLGKLPGDIRVEKENFRLYVPLTTSILLSVLASVVLWLISNFRK
jgi:hypothetical protein